MRQRLLHCIKRYLMLGFKINSIESLQVLRYKKFKRFNLTLDFGKTSQIWEPKFDTKSVMKI